MNNYIVAPVSVVIPCYRCALTIRRSVESVLAQSLPPYEILLIDDCSDDNSETLSALEEIKYTAPNSNITILELSINQGPGSARNEGWRYATQPYIAFLDADDSWHPNKLEIQYSWMCAHPHVTLSAHPSIQLGKGLPLRVFGDLHARRVSIDSLLFSNCLPCRSVMLKRNIEERFMEGKRQAEDYLLWLSIGLRGGEIWYLNHPLAYSFKNDFGEKGLGSKLGDSYKGVLETYHLLCQKGYIAKTTYYFLVLLSFLKHVRRKLLSFKK